MLTGMPACAGPVGRSFARVDRYSGGSVGSKPGLGLGPATPRVAASTWARMTGSSSMRLR